MHFSRAHSFITRRTLNDDDDDGVFSNDPIGNLEKKISSVIIVLHPSASMTGAKRRAKKEEAEEEDHAAAAGYENTEQYLLPPGLETDCFDLVRAWQSRRREKNVALKQQKEEEKEEERRASEKASPSVGASNERKTERNREASISKGESPFQSFRLLYIERNFDRMFHLKTKFTNPNEQLQRLYDASLAIWDLANDRVFREKENNGESTTSSSLFVGALYLLFMFYRRQPRRDAFFVRPGFRGRAKALEADDELPKARVYVSLMRMRELLEVSKRLEEEVEQKKEKGTKNKKSGNVKKEEEEEEEEEEDNDVEAALETLAIIREMVADNAFIVGCTRPLTQRERRDLVESSKVVVKNELIEAYEEVRDEMISLENGGIPGVAALLEQTETYGKALDAVLVNKQRPASSTYAAGLLDPAKKIGGAVNRFAKRLEGKLEEILKAQPKQKRARKTPTFTNYETKELQGATTVTNEEPSSKVVTTTVDGLKVVNTKKTTIVTKTKKAPVSKRKKERRDLESMPDYYEKEKGK